MNLTTILNPFHPMFPGERRARLAEWAWSTAGRHLPKRLAYWSLLATCARNIEGDEEVPAVPFMTILERAGRELRA
jgi:hypothetical protein